MMQLSGIPTLKLNHAVLKSQVGTGIGKKLTVGAYRNGMGSICMLMSTEYHNNHWDIIPRHMTDLELYKKDRMSLHKKGFKLAQSIYDKDENSDERELTNDTYYDLFQNLPVQMVTTQQGTKECYLCRSFSFTPSTMGEIMAVLDRHKVDWPEFRVVKQFYSKQAFEQEKETTHQPIPSPTNPTTNINPIDPSYPASHSPLIQRELFFGADLSPSNSNNSSTISTTNNCQSPS